MSPSRGLGFEISPTSHGLLIKDTEPKQVSGSRSSESQSFYPLVQPGSCKVTCSHTRWNFLLVSLRNICSKVYEMMLSWKTHKDSDSPFGWRTTNLLIIGNLVDVSAPSLWKPPRSRVGWRQRPRWLRPRLGPSLLGVLPGLLSVVGFCQRSLAEVKKSSILSLLHFFFF